MAAVSIRCESTSSRRRSCRPLIWHKWQSYSTWLSGFFLLVWVYYAQSDLYLVDPAVRELTPLAASGIGIGALAAGWLVYHGLSKALKDQDALLAGLGCC